MRIQPIDVNHAKAAAKRLRDLSTKGAAGTRPLALARAMETVARMLGFRHWHELQATSAPGAPLDDAVPTTERRERRRQQAAALEAEGFSPAAAAGAVEAILPSGDFDREAERATQHIEKLVIANGNVRSGVEAEAEWMMENLGMPRSDLAFAMEAAAARSEMDGGLVSARSRRMERVKVETHDRTGWFAIVSEEHLFYQGYYMHDPGPELAAEVEATTRRVLADGSRGIEGFLQNLAGAFASGSFAAPGTYIGALQACACSTAVSGRGDAVRTATFGWLISKESGLDLFVVHLRGLEAGGFRTELAKLDAVNVGEARSALERLPEVRRIQGKLLEKIGLGGIDPSKFMKG